MFVDGRAKKTFEMPRQGRLAPFPFHVVHPDAVQLRFASSAAPTTGKADQTIVHVVRGFSHGDSRGQREN
jgi:hypothetical protein